MSCHYHQMLLEMAAMADLVSATDAGCGGHLQCTFVKLVAGVSDG